MGRIFVFHGADHKVGTTMVSQSVAEMAAAGNKGLKILFAALCGKSRKEYVKETVGTMEDLKLYLMNQVLNKDEVISMTKVEENLHMIAGVGSLLEERHYHPDVAEYFLTTVKEDFDLIIVDGGNDIDNGLAFGALKQADCRILVTTQQEVALRSWERVAHIYEEFDISFQCVVINQFQRDDAHTESYMSKRMGFPAEDMFPIQWAGYGRQAEQEGRTLLAYKNEAYINDVLSVTNWVLMKDGREPVEKQRRSRWKGFI